VGSKCKSVYWFSYQ